MKSRVLTAVGLIPFVLGAFFCASPWPLLGFAVVVCAICTWEIANLLDSLATWLGILLLFGFIKTFQDQGHVPEGQLAVIGYFLGGLYFAFRSAQRKRKNSLFAALATPWVLIPLLCLISLHGVSSTASGWNFKTPLLLAVVPLWGGDTAAIFAGRAFGKHPLAPSISPKKTVEGAVANLLACIAVAVPLSLWIGYSVTIGLGCGVVAGILGQAGDLFESYIKRLAGVKDSGRILPGHGGVLDRIDSILFTAPFVWLLLSFVK